MCHRINYADLNCGSWRKTGLSGGLTRDGNPGCFFTWPFYMFFYKAFLQNFLQVFYRSNCPKMASYNLLHDVQ